MSIPTPSRRPPRRRRPSAAFDRLEPRALLATITVVNTNDDGPGSLRTAITRANAAPGIDTIAFAIPGEGPHVIAPASGLPGVTDPVVIDGYTQPGARPNGQATGFDADLRIVLDGANAGPTDGLRLGGSRSVVRGLAIRRFQFGGIVVSGEGNRVEGNILGASADPAEGNGFGVQIYLGDRNTIGGTAPAARNLISGNRGVGVDLYSIYPFRFPGDLASGNAIQGNLIGTDPSGEGSLGNAAEGVRLGGVPFFSEFNSNGNTIGGAEPGAGNVIAFNGGAGVQGGGVVLSNLIFENVGLGIDRSTPGPDRFPSSGLLAGYPLLIEATPVDGGTRIRGVLINRPDQATRLEFFAGPGDPTGFGEGRTLLGAADVTTGADGTAAFDVVVPGVPPEGALVTATATTSDSGTSEFSPTPELFTSSANLVVEAAASTAEARSGDELTYTATVRNLGPGPATDARLIIDRPYFRFSAPFAPEARGPVLSSSVSRGTLAVEENRLVGMFGTLEPGAVATVTFTIGVPSPPTEGAIPLGPPALITSFNAESATLDLFANNQAFVDVAVDRASIAYEVRPRAGTVTVGEPVTIDFVVTNRGPATASNVVFNPFFLVAEYGLDAIETSRGTVREDRSVALGDLAPGETATVSYTIRPTRAGPLFLSAMISSPNSPFAESVGPLPTISADPPGGASPIRLSLPDLPRGLPRRVDVAFDTDLDIGRATDPASYRVEVLLPGGRSRTVAVQAATYETGTRTVTLETARPLPPNRTIRVTAFAAGLLRPDGVPIDGDGDGGPGGDFVGRIEARHSVRYRDADGDRVALALGGGLIQVNRGPLGDPRALRLLPVGRRPALLGRVLRAPDGDGQATLPPIEGAEGVRLRLPRTIALPS